MVCTAIAQAILATISGLLVCRRMVPASRSLPAFLLIALVAPACGGNTAQQGEASDVGENVDYVVIEGGFACPESLPSYFDVGEVGICMEAPADLPRETCALLGACASSSGAEQSVDDQQAADGVDQTIMEEPLVEPTGAEQPADEAVMEAASARLIPPSSDTQGMGDCAQTSVGDAAAAVVEENPELDGITTFVPDPIYDEPAPDPGGDFYYASVSESSIFLAFRRCEGEVIQGVCDDVRFDFFTTAEACVPTPTGSYTAALSSDGCYDVTGDASPDFPELAVRDRDRCDFDPMPQAVAGNYELAAVGIGSICEQTVESPIPMEVAIVQDDSDPSVATITLSNTGFDCVDGVAIPGRVIMDVVEGELALSETSTRSEDDLCAPPAKLVFSLGGDWGGLPFIGLLDYMVLDGDGCSAAGPSYVAEGSVHFSEVAQ